MPDATPRPNRVSESVVGDASPPPSSLETWLGMPLVSAIKVVWQSARRFYQRKQDAENLTQEVWCRILEVSAKAGSERPKNPKAWLNTVTANTFFSEYRHAQAAKCGSGRIPAYLDTTDPADYESQGTEEVALKNLQASQVRKALCKLPQYQQDLIVDRYFNELTLEAMSALRGRIPKTTLKSQLDAAIRDLRRTMKSESETR